MRAAPHPFGPGRAALLLLLGLCLGVARAAAQQPGDSADRPIDLGSQSGDLGEIDRFPLQLTGFAAGDYSYSGRTGDNSFARYSSRSRVAGRNAMSSVIIFSAIGCSPGASGDRVSTN